MTLIYKAILTTILKMKTGRKTIKTTNTLENAFNLLY